MKKLALILLSLNLIGCGFEVVDTGYRGLETRFGQVVGEPLPEGLHFYNPFTSDIKEYYVRQETWEVSQNIFTQDNQQAMIKIAVNFYPDPSLVNKIYVSIGSEDNLKEKIIKPVVIGTMQTVIGKVIADELNAKKDQVAKQAFMAVKENLAEKHVILTDLQFVDTDFSDEYEKAAEEKVVAIQQAQKAKNETVRIEEEAKQTVKTAQAEAEAMRIKSQALSQNKGLVEFELAKKWDGKLPAYMFGSTIPMIDVKSLTK